MKFIPRQAVEDRYPQKAKPRPNRDLWKFRRRRDVDSRVAGGHRLKWEATGSIGCYGPLWGIKRTNPFTFGERVVYEKVAATYFPAFYCSIIGAKGLNFSVRDGKRWTPLLKPPSMS